MTTLVIADRRISSILGYIAGHGAQAWIVGGFLRDSLLGRPSHDVDLVLPGHVFELARDLARAFGGTCFVLDQEREASRVLLRSEAGAPLSVDLARLRAPDLPEDLALRDFTINAMAAEIRGDAGPAGIIDPFGGQGDLAGRLVAAVSDRAFRDDPLRTLRGVRLAVELGFDIAAGTRGLIRRDAGLLAESAAERVRDELARILGAPGAWQHLRLMAGLDLLRLVLPEAQALVGVGQSEPHYLDVFDHTRAVLAHAEGILAALGAIGNGEHAAASTPYSLPPSPYSLSSDPVQAAPSWQWVGVTAALAPFATELRAHLARPLAGGRSRQDLFQWAALAHDWGKPATRSVGDDGRIHFYEHDRLGARLARERMASLAFSTAEIEYVAALVCLHMRPGNLARAFPPTQRALYRLARAAASCGPDVALLALADRMGTREEAEDEFRALLEVCRLAFDAYFHRHDAWVDPAPLLDGRQIMAELKLEPGREVGRLLEALKEAQAVGEVRTADEARRWLRGQGRLGATGLP